MGRMYGKGKGVSSSSIPFQRSAPAWLKPTVQMSANTIALEATKEIHKMAKKGKTPSQIGVSLRDVLGIPQVKSLTGSKILRILKLVGMAPEIPEDLNSLVQKARAIKKHIAGNKRDKDSSYRLIVTESRIQRLERYYKQSKKLPPTWCYSQGARKTL